MIRGNLFFDSRGKVNRMTDKFVNTKEKGDLRLDLNGNDLVLF